MVRMLLGILKLVVIMKMVVMLNVVDRVYKMMLKMVATVQIVANG